MNNLAIDYGVIKPYSQGDRNFKLREIFRLERDPIKFAYKRKGASDDRIR